LPNPPGLHTNVFPELDHALRLASIFLVIVPVRKSGQSTQTSKYNSPSTMRLGGRKHRCSNWTDLGSFILRIQTIKITHGEDCCVKGLFLR